MSLVNLDAAQTRINVHLDKSLRWLSSCRLANRRIQAYHCVIAMCVVHPALLMLALYIVLRIRSMSTKFHPHTARHGSSPSCHKAGPISKKVGETTDLPLAEETTVLRAIEVIAFLLVIIRQRLLMSGDVELNPGPVNQGLTLASD